MRHVSRGPWPVPGYKWLLVSCLWKKDPLLENLNWTEAARGWTGTQRFPWGREKWGSGSGSLEDLQDPVESENVADGTGILTWVVVGLHLGVCGWASPGRRATWYQTGSHGPVYWSNEVPGCSRCDFLGYWDSLWKHQGIGRVGPGGALGGPKRRLCSGERSLAAGRLGLQGHIRRSSALSGCPSIRGERGDPGPFWDTAIPPTSQGRRARLPRSGPRPPPPAHSPSLARSLAR